MEIANKKEQIGIRIPEKLNERLKERAVQMGISRPAFILSLLYKELVEKRDDKQRLRE